MKTIEKDLESEFVNAINEDNVEEVDELFKEVRQNFYGENIVDKFKEMYYTYKVKKLNKVIYKKHR